MSFKKKLYLCAMFVDMRVKGVTDTYNRLAGIMAFVMMLCMPVFLYAQAYQHVSLGASAATATVITDSVSADVNDGAHNFFTLANRNLPATVYYWADTAFGPVPALLNASDGDSLPATMVVENCRMGWRWELSRQSGNASRTLTFAAHEGNAYAEILPYVCQPVQTIEEPVAVCEVYQWGDTTIYDSGIYSRRYQSADGCDSIVSKRVDILEVTYGTATITAYDSYTWIDGVTYTHSSHGNIAYLTNVAGCDSVVSLDLTIKHLLEDTVRRTICASEAPFDFYGKSCTASGTYTTDTLRADETDTLHTLILTVNPTYAEETRVELCAEEYSWNGQVYTQSGNYPYNGRTLAGCDSVVTLRLTLKRPSASEESQRAYGSYTWHDVTYTNSGNYTYTTTNAVGCDSVITLHLIIDKDTIVEFYCPKSGIIEHEDTTSSTVVCYRPYSYVKPDLAQFMEGVVSGETKDGANVDLARLQANLEAWYVAPMTPIETVYWHYTAFNGDTRDITAEARWMDGGAVSVNIVFRCGYRYYGSFRIGYEEEEGGGTEDVQNVRQNDQPLKRIENGQVVIIRGGAKYTIMGVKISEETK